jgi:hypothetical protein
MTKPANNDSVARFIGLVFMGVSVLWIAFCGLCAVGVLATVFTEAGGILGLLGSLAFVFVISGLGAAAGYGVFVIGRNLWRPK